MFYKNYEDDAANKDYHLSSVICDKPTYPHSTIKTKYPSTPGSTLEVKCNPGHVNMGSQTITCQEDGTWGFEIQPSCQELGKIRSTDI